MKVEIFYCDLIPAPDFEKKGKIEVEIDVDKIKTDYYHVWAGTTDYLKINTEDDWEILEIIFDLFNQKKPENFSHRFRSLSIGDVIALDQRFYVCQTLDWRQLSQRETQAFSAVKQSN